MLPFFFFFVAKNVKQPVLRQTCVALIDFDYISQTVPVIVCVGEEWRGEHEKEGVKKESSGFLYMWEVGWGCF